MSEYSHYIEQAAYEDGVQSGLKLANKRIAKLLDLFTYVTSDGRRYTGLHGDEEVTKDVEDILNDVL